MSAPIGQPTPAFSRSHSATEVQPMPLLPPRSALAAKVTDDVLTRRVAAALDRGDDCLAVVFHSEMADGMVRTTRLQHRIAGPQIRRPGIAHAARIDHLYSVYGAVKRPVRVADTHQVRRRCSSG